MTEQTGIRPTPAQTDFFCCGVRVAGVNLLEAQNLIVGWRLDRRRRTVHLCNAYTLSLAARDASLRKALNGSTLNLADGRPVVWMGRLTRRTKLRQPVPGPDLFALLLDGGQDFAIRHYLYGANPTVLSSLQQTIKEMYPRALITGAESRAAHGLPNVEDLALKKRLVDARPDIIWVGLGTPQQDFFIEHYLKDVAATFIAVGAAFDFTAGSRRRAPIWLRRFPGEWLFRLFQEPRRLWRRYLVDSLMFFYFMTLGAHNWDESPHL